MELSGNYTFSEANSIWKFRESAFAGSRAPSRCAIEPELICGEDPGLMGRSLFFSAAVCLFVAVSATAQSVSLLPPASPFRIEPGTSFSASTERKPAAGELGTASVGTARIMLDFTDALDVI